MRAHGSLIWIGLCLETMSCGDGGGRPCTDIPCQDRLSVQTDLDATSIELTVGDEVRTCAKGDDACWSSDEGNQVARFYNFSPQQVSVRVLDAGGQVLAESTEQPEYEPYRLYDECPPYCRAALVVVE